MRVVVAETIGRQPIVSWSPWVRAVFVGRGSEYRPVCPASPLAEGERAEVRGECPQSQSGSSYPSPSPSPLQKERRWRSHVKLSCHCRAKPYKIALASSSLGVSPQELHLALFPQDQIATRARVAKMRCNYENEQQN
jgi:hypothetical protein